MLAAFFVPLSQCSHGGKANAPPPPAKTGWQKIFPRSDAQTEYDYGAKHVDLSLHGGLTLVAFGWPFVLALVGRRARGKRRAWILYGVELLLCAGTIWWIYAVTEGATRLWGAYCVFALTSVYAVAALLDLAASWQHRIARAAGS